MTLEEQLKQEILSRYKSVRAFTLSIDIPYTTLDSVFKRGISNSGVSTMIKVFDALGLDVESITGGTLLPKQPIRSLPAAEPDADPLLAALLNNFGRLNQEGRELLVEQSDTMVSSGKYSLKNVPDGMDSKEA